MKCSIKLGSKINCDGEAVIYAKLEHSKRLFCFCSYHKDHFLENGARYTEVSEAEYLTYKVLSS